MGWTRPLPLCSVIEAWTLVLTLCSLIFAWTTWVGHEHQTWAASSRPLGLDSCIDIVEYHLCVGDLAWTRTVSSAIFALVTSVGLEQGPCAVSSLLHCLDDMAWTRSLLLCSPIFSLVHRLDLNLDHALSHLGLVSSHLMLVMRTYRLERALL